MAFASPLLVFGWMLLWNNLFPSTFLGCKQRPGFVCLEMLPAIGLLPLLALSILRFRSDPVHPVATGAALGSTVAAWAGVAMDLSCECSQPSHVALGHILPMVLLAGFGALLGWRVISASARWPGKNE